MDILGIGPLELGLILLIVFMVVGPKDLAATGKKIGRFLSTVRKSEFWKGVSQITKEVRTLPTTLMREAELEELQKEIKEDANAIKNLSKEFEVDVPEWRKSARKEFSAPPKAAETTDSQPPTEAPVETLTEAPVETQTAAPTETPKEIPQESEESSPTEAQKE